MKLETNPPVIVFDGICLLCSRWVRFLLKHDHAERYHFASMQSEKGRALLLTHGLDPDSPLSFLLVEDGHDYTDTRAIVKILHGLGQRRWRWLGHGLRLVPRWLSDPAYRFVARHRYRIFGQSRRCFLPTPEQRARFSP
ncbi:thiol-disulfide oxidoreductase DCC family protein [Rhodanobacter sp. AS-Z3]|uniref:thiol-disulfide oxidoreductase DCC family protein n=1 Tax=Rhodanobacter sp. AS-Z3 TaxID=3031330 RepID=UPI002479DD8F|nr:thiol-disulfide oxidoreductase DCC family protein [Rhodanobacter sp. AS-Z3]WEN15890.1 thiol-disulfide oxidoreductase DCC family protein [Rhodanobacter sp. AS-Z3]